jgi:archaemetzincin
LEILCAEFLAVTAQGLEKILPETKCFGVSDVLPVPIYAYDRGRKQYKSSVILNDIRTYGIRQREFDHVLGLVDADVYALGLNYVFGEAYATGIAGLVSLTSLRPEFYGEAVNEGLFIQRLVKESVHEVGIL